MVFVKCCVCEHDESEGLAKLTLLHCRACVCNDWLLVGHRALVDFPSLFPPWCQILIRGMAKKPNMHAIVSSCGLWTDRMGRGLIANDLQGFVKRN